MVFHPPGIVVEIVRTEAGDQGHSCDEHPANCGEVLEPDVVVRLLKVQLMIEGREETAIAAVWVTVIGHGIGGIDIPIMARLVKARRWSKR
jgi:hypothetical protein